MLKVYVVCALIDVEIANQPQWQKRVDSSRIEYNSSSDRYSSDNRMITFGD
jgi:hypothetical protein